MWVLFKRSGFCFISTGLHSVSVVIGLVLKIIGEYAFAKLCDLKATVPIPHNVKVFSKAGFYGWKSFEDLRFESGSELERIEEKALRSGRWGDRAGG
jgi:hypothetical protein